MLGVLERNRAGKLGELAKVPWVLAEISSIPPALQEVSWETKVSKIRAHQKSFSSQAYLVLRRGQLARLGEESFPPYPPRAIPQ